ncbi:glycerophosphodiester phosphodiesterase [Bifidobacterium aemilianum]|uniref:Glycerophosphodiester phosphodiesterase n=1 Tax=Bifidobacterium aemilianum TaxID=2493120 RepID=A0A366K7X0_9BIFI|nr:glycerophosphodiester phosphodiesterase family protein [Bifidobacterium aemilianum]RBP97213.1 glycerophosphodiester phosphodiesterase [Bifidobacterium aemilianum]
MSATHILRAALLAGAAGVGATLWAIAPRSFNDKRRNYVPALPDVPYAHRGLHDAGSGLTPRYAAESGEYVALARRMALRAGYGTADFTGPLAPENSLAAFAAAAEAGYGIELDLQLTADGQVVVVHDPDLRRVAGDPRRIEDLTYEALTWIPLFPAPAKPGDSKVKPVPQADATGNETATVAAASGQESAPAAAVPDYPEAPEGYYQHVPLLEDVLRVVGGRVPLIVEYKIDHPQWGEYEEELMAKGNALLSAYHGPYVIESFNPLALRWYKEHNPSVSRGQLAADRDLKTGLKEPGKLLAAKLLLDNVGRPDFIAYAWQGGSTPQMRLTRRLGAVPVSWTIRSQEELAQATPWFDRHIFESFVPRS